MRLALVVVLALGCQAGTPAPAPAPTPPPTATPSGTRLTPFPKVIFGNPNDRRLQHMPASCWKQPEPAGYRGDYQYVLVERVLIAYLGGLLEVPPDLLVGLHPKVRTAVIGPAIESSDLPFNVSVSTDPYLPLSQMWDSRRDRLDVVELTLVGEVDDRTNDEGVILVKYTARPVFADRTRHGRGTRATLCIPFHTGDEMTIYLEDLGES